MIFWWREGAIKLAKSLSLYAQSSKATNFSLLDEKVVN